MKRGIEGQEMLEEYIKIGAYLKIMCNVAVTASTVIAGDFNKTNPLHRRMERISRDLEQLRSDLEDSMPYDETTILCNENEINPLDIFYGYTNLNKVNKEQMQLIYDKFMKKTLESED